MKRTIFSILSLLLTLSMLLGAFAACAPSPQETETTSSTSSTEAETTKKSDESEDDESSNTSEITSSTDEISPDDSDVTAESSLEDTESNTEKVIETESDADSEEKVEVTLPENTRNAATIEYANSMANGVQAYFTNPQRTSFSFENKEMYLEYALASNAKQQVTVLKNVNNGHAYIENTMDVYVKMADSGNVYYASKSTIPTAANIYRFGYYYYEMRLEEQIFSDDVVVTDEKKINHMQVYSAHDIKGHYFDNSGVLYVSNSDASSADPYIILGKQYSGYDFSASKYSFLKIKMKADINCTAGGQVFIIAGDKTNFNAQQSVGFTIVPDGELHEYIVPLHGIEGYTDTLKGIRLDVTGVNGSYELHGMSLLAIDVGDAPSTLALNRSFHTYSDKMHHTVQVAATKETNNISAVGITTSIAKNTVDKLIAVDKDGNQYTDIDDVPDWSIISYVAFDIIDAGIFGYILPYDGSGGTIKVTLEGDNYVIIQERIPENGTIIPSRGAFDEKKGYYTSVVAHNANDFYINHRIYTDGNHDFGEFLIEAYNETHPIYEKLVNVGESSTGASYYGYDAARGIYRFTVEGPAGGFNTAYYKSPNKHYNVNFTIRGESTDRNIYVMTYTTVGALECAALLDQDNLMLPVPLEVGKNFSEASGERNLFNINDETYGEVIFPLVVEADVKNEYTILNLYQRWGNYPLKQLSWIQFNAPYYHLSTGVTETNCILPWYSTKNSKGLNTLPDFRTMSATFWETQPQHDACGVHQWLIYTDADGNRITSENIADYIDSYGPTYADVKMDYVSDDGKIKITYSHSEMPQIDENRTYYEIKYEVLEDVTIKDFRNNFQFYSVGPRNAGGYYKKIGYLDASNKIQHVDSVIEVKDDKGNIIESETKSYVLGSNCPYFSFFDMDGTTEGYANVSALIYSSSFVIGGEEATPSFIINNVGKKISLSLDLDDVTLKAGDEFSINMILLPWGSHELDPDYEDVGDVNYYTVIDESTGEMYLDKNVRDVRENTLINALKATANKDCEVISSVFVPKLKTTNGKSAEFTLSGGNDNTVVRIYGFEKLTAPKVQILEGNEWKEYQLNSSNNPDEPGYIHYYDGYNVYYDGDGTFSYSFVTSMDNGKAKTLRIVCEEDFKNWPAEPIIDENREDHLDVFVDAVEIYDNLFGGVWISDATVSEDESFVRLFGTGEDALNSNGGKVTEGYINAYINNSGSVETGQFIVLKYRLPSTNSKKIDKFEFFVSTTSASATSGNRVQTTQIVADDKWHIIVIDLSKEENASFLANEYPATDGKYYARILRFDFFDKWMEKTDYIDIAFIGIDNNLDEIREYFVDTETYIETPAITLLEGTSIAEIDIASGNRKEISAPKLDAYVHPSCSDYVQTTLPYAACVDGINGKTIQGGANTKNLLENGINSKTNKLSYSGTTIANFANNCAQNPGTNLVVSGWVVIDGGVNKYVYSIDGGKTWKDCSGYGLTVGNVSDAHLPNAANRIGMSDNSPFTTADDKTNGLFQGLNANTPKGITADLSDYVGEIVHVIFAAVSAKEPNQLALIAYVTDVQVVDETTVIEPSNHGDYIKEGSDYTASNLAFAACIDRIHSVGFGTNQINSVNKKVTVLEFNGTTIAAYGTENYASTPGNYLVFSGWSIVQSGVSKYVWSADGGLTWNDAECYGMEHPVSAGNDILASSRLQGLGYTFSLESDSANCKYQAPGGDKTQVKGMAANLFNYAGKTVDVIFAAVPNADTSTLCIIAVATGVQVPAAQ